MNKSKKLSLCILLLIIFVLIIAACLFILKTNCVDTSNRGSLWNIFSDCYERYPGLEIHNCPALVGIDWCESLQECLPVEKCPDSNNFILPCDERVATYESLISNENDLSYCETDSACKLIDCPECKTGYKCVEVNFTVCSDVNSQKACTDRSDCLAVDYCSCTTESRWYQQCEIVQTEFCLCIQGGFWGCENLNCTLKNYSQPDKDVDKNITVSGNIIGRVEISTACQTDLDCMLIDENVIIKACCPKPTCWDFSQKKWVSVNKGSYNKAVDATEECISLVECLQLSPPQCADIDRDYISQCLFGTCQKRKPGPFLREEDITDYIKLAQAPHKLNDCKEYNNIKKIGDRWSFFCWSKTSGSFEGYITETGKLEDIEHTDTTDNYSICCSRKDLANEGRIYNWEISIENCIGICNPPMPGCLENEVVDSSYCE